MCMHEALVLPFGAGKCSLRVPHPTPPPVCHQVHRCPSWWFSASTPPRMTVVRCALRWQLELSSSTPSASSGLSIFPFSLWINCSWFKCTADPCHFVTDCFWVREGARVLAWLWIYLSGLWLSGQCASLAFQGPLQPFLLMRSRGIFYVSELLRLGARVYVPCPFLCFQLWPYFWGGSHFALALLSTASLHRADKVSSVLFLVEGLISRSPPCTMEYCKCFRMSHCQNIYISGS